MALIVRKEVCGGFIALWRIEESVDELLRLASLSESESSCYIGLKTERRRQEWLAWRVMAKRFTGCSETGYGASGQPVVTEGGYISVSHSGDMVALYYNEIPCGIDMEDLSRDFTLAAARVVSQAECGLAKGMAENEFAALAWCAKEAAFKYAGRKGVDFMRDLRIVSVDTAEKKVEMKLFEAASMRLSYEAVEGMLLVYTT